MVQTPSYLLGLDVGCPRGQQSAFDRGPRVSPTYTLVKKATQSGVRMSRPTSELCSFMRQKMLTHLPCISPMQCFVPMRDIPANSLSLRSHMDLSRWYVLVNLALRRVARPAAARRCYRMSTSCCSFATSSRSRRCEEPEHAERLPCSADAIRIW